MQNYQIFLVAAVSVLAIGFLLGVKASVFFSRVFGRNRNNYRRSRYNHWEDDHYNSRGGYDHREDRGNSLPFGFIMILIIGVALAFVFKSEISKWKLGDVSSTGLLVTEKNKNQVAVKVVAPQPLSSDEIPEALPAPAKANPSIAPVQEETDTPPKPTAAEDKFILQLGAFTLLESAKRKITKLQNRGIKVQHVTKIINDTEMYIVFAGPYNTKSDAEAVQQDLKEKDSIIRQNTL